MSGVRVWLPEEYAAGVLEMLGSEEAERYFQSLEEPPCRALRLHRRKRHSSALLEMLKGRARYAFAESAYSIDSEDSFGRFIYHELGAYYIQEPSAMLPVQVLNPQPAERVLDLCAAPGSKATQIGERLAGKGLLVANEVHRGRAAILNENLKRMGIRNALVLSMRPDLLERPFFEYFDAILVDAPCSGEGMFRKNPAAIQEWSVEHVLACSRRQREILRSASAMLRPGGRLVYSTCTLNRTENEETAEWLVSQGDLHLLPFTIAGMESGNGMLKLWPQRFAGEGHFIAQFRKSAGTAESFSKAPQKALSISRPSRQEQALFEDFCARNKIRDFFPNFKYQDYLMQIPEDLPLQGLNVIDAGIRLGSVKKNLFFPEHSFAQMIEDEAAVHYSLSAEQARAYVAGEALYDIDSPHSGFVLLRYEGYPLGWGKITEGVMKNHYPKHLRKQITV